ncbi:hypothetical protein G4X40_21225 [Rhodococcus sp. D2-41]|uniref:Uncharacterized protein n=1 Tax=Speluncibacter jeojiensis TaxID=2710754 RepID=A0A9X4M4T6_9ACTN|nr:hypothetical protein [Rhodococcus sp. D2-41]MDG3012667.1 hypothetical protein [Rhodococcus sp. D2-41]MDG3015228.1 hypothetical protein [Corynebacteriales bacterium D3-21]
MSSEESWAEAFGRMQAFAFTTVHGLMRSQVHEDGATEEREVEFWHQSPDRWRIEDELGLWYLDDGERVLLRTGNDMALVSLTTHLGPLPHPRTVLGTVFGGRRVFGWSDDFTRPLGSGTPVVVAGRRATEFRLAATPGKRADKPYPLRVAVDERTGIPLRVATPEAGYVHEIVALDVDSILPPDIFEWRGPVSTATRDERERRRAGQNWAREQDLPVPRWWPRGVSYSPREGDPETGAFRATLDVNGLAVLFRWPCGTALPEKWKDGFRQYPLHEWADEEWHWALLVDTPLSESDLARVVESIPRDR